MRPLVHARRAPVAVTAVVAAAGFVITAQLALAQMISPPVDTVAAGAASQATPPGIAAVPTPMVPPVASTATAPTAEARVAPVKRIAPKTPALPTIVAKAIAKAKQVKAVARSGAASSQALAAPMALGAKSAAAAQVACQPGETFVRRAGTCQKRGAPATRKASVPVKKSPSKATSAATRSRSKS